jgi:hypothetical protein
MVVFRIPKPISIIGENTSKSITFATCNFSIAIDGSLDIGQNYLCQSSKLLFDYLKESKETRKDEIIKNYHKTQNNAFFSKTISSTFGGLNYTTITEDSWFNIKLKANKVFNSYILAYEINKTFFTNDMYNTENLLNPSIVEKMTSDFYDSYQKENWDFLGKLINGFWKIKREKYPESRNNYIDKLYSDCRLSGVIGGKMDGSTMILFVHPENHEKIKSIMSDHILLNSSMDISGFVSQEVFSGISNCCE